MTERERPRLHESVFVRLIATMMAMAVFSLAMVSAFYFFVLMPGLHRSMDRFVAQHLRAIAATSPDSAAAQGLIGSLEMDIRYDGPAGTWTTDESVPRAQTLLPRSDRARGRHTVAGHAYYVLRAPQGGHYVFVRAFGTHIYVAHSRMLLVLLLLMVGVFLAAYGVLRRALRPLRLLNEGVAQLSEGHLDVVVPQQSDDEFGALTRAFNRMTGRVREMIRARDQLLLDVSHELRSPLTRLRVALALQPEDKMRTGMEADIAEMETMVTELLELERLRDGRSVRIEREDLVAIIREAIAGHENRPPGVRMSSAPQALTIEVDCERVQTVMRNVIENALKYSLPDSRPVEVTIVDSGETVVVRVTDDGPGIPESDRAGLFEPFFRLDRSRSKKTGGYGLGLSICRRIMEAHGGSISAENHAPRGAAFVMTFPRTGPHLKEP